MLFAFSLLLGLLPGLLLPLLGCPDFCSSCLECHSKSRLQPLQLLLLHVLSAPVHSGKKTKKKQQRTGLSNAIHRYVCIHVTRSIFLWLYKKFYPQTHKACKPFSLFAGARTCVQIRSDPRGVYKTHVYRCIDVHVEVFADPSRDSRLGSIPVERHKERRGEWDTERHAGSTRTRRAMDV